MTALDRSAPSCCLCLEARVAFAMPPLRNAGVLWCIFMPGTTMGFWLKCRLAFMHAEQNAILGTDRDGLFWCPPTTKAVGKQIAINAVGVSRLRYGQLPSKKYIRWYATVGLLLRGRSPAAIIGGIIAAGIFAVKRMSRWARSQVHKEGREVISPALADANAAPAVVLIVSPVASIAAPPHFNPTCIFGRSNAVARAYRFHDIIIWLASIIVNSVTQHRAKRAQAGMPLSTQIAR